MRPTELHFRSPKQRTPEFYDSRVRFVFYFIKVTKEGKILNFRPGSMNKKRTFPS